MPLFEKWIRVKLLACIREVDQRLERYEFSAAVDAIRTFFWNDLCDWYIEEVKSHLREAAADDAEKNDVKITLLQTFDIVLCLFHPAIPFVTEAIWSELGREIPRHHELIWPAADSSIQNPKSKIQNGPPPTAPMLIAMPWPKAVPEIETSAADAAWLREVAAQTTAEREVDTFLAVIRALREIRTSLNAIRSQAKQPALRNLPAAVVRCDSANAELLRRGEATILRLGQVEKGGLTISPDAPKPPQSMSRVLTVAGTASATQTIEIYVPIAGLADLDVERKRLAKDRDEAAAALQRLEGKLANEGFIAKAKPEVIEAERARMSELKEKLAAIERNLTELQ
jgi:valyl-tRNA synthetase